VAWSGKKQPQKTGFQDHMMMHWCYANNKWGCHIGVYRIGLRKTVHSRVCELWLPRLFFRSKTILLHAQTISAFNMVNTNNHGLNRIWEYQRIQNAEKQSIEKQTIVVCCEWVLKLKIYSILCRLLLTCSNRFNLSVSITKWYNHFHFFWQTCFRWKPSYNLLTCFISWKAYT
jgi:hypothetical protein